MGMGPIRIVATALLLGALAACAAPAPQSNADGSAEERAETRASDAGQPPGLAQATPRPRVGERIDLPPMSTPYPPARVDRGSAVQVDRRCRTDADCMVKDVGNCCGAMPACVNRASPTDPAGVRAQCAKDGMASACGSSGIEGCRCANGQCVAAVAPLDPSADPPVPVR